MAQMYRGFNPPQPGIPQSSSEAVTQRTSLWLVRQCNYFAGAPPHPPHTPAAKVKGKSALPPESKGFGPGQHTLSKGFGPAWKQLPKDTGVAQPAPAHGTGTFLSDANLKSQVPSALPYPRRAEKHHPPHPHAPLPKPSSSKPTGAPRRGIWHPSPSLGTGRGPCSFLGAHSTSLPPARPRVPFLASRADRDSGAANPPTRAPRAGAERHDPTMPAAGPGLPCSAAASAASRSR